jgi:hypothetical protein
MKISSTSFFLRDFCLAFINLTAPREVFQRDAEEGSSRAQGMHIIVEQEVWRPARVEGSAFASTVLSGKTAQMRSSGNTSRA